MGTDKTKKLITGVSVGEQQEKAEKILTHEVIPREIAYQKMIAKKKKTSQK